MMVAKRQVEQSDGSFRRPSADLDVYSSDSFYAVRIIRHLLYLGRVGARRYCLHDDDGIVV